MHRTSSFPMTLERSRTKERLEASLTGLCELELRKQRQECLVLGALALGDPMIQNTSRNVISCFSSWGQENLTLRRQLSALQSSPWGLMQALEQQVGELRIDPPEESYDGAEGATRDSCLGSGFHESSEDHSPKERSCCTEPTETICSWVYINDRPKSMGEPLVINGDFLDVQQQSATLPRSFSAPYPPLEGIAEEPWQWNANSPSQAWHQQAMEDHLVEEDYQWALRVEGYILGLIQRHTLSPRPCQPRTSLSPDPSGQSGQHMRTTSQTPEHCLPDPRVDPSAKPESQCWGCDLLEGEACEGEAPSLEEDCYLALPYPHTRPPSLAGGQPQPLASLDPHHGAGVIDLCREPQSPQHYSLPQSPAHHSQHLVSAQYIPGQGSHAPGRSPRHYAPGHPKPSRVITSAEQPGSKLRASNKSHDERQSSRKPSSKTSRSQSENSILSQRQLPERRYSTTERPQVRRDQAPDQGQVMDGNSSHNGTRRWCSNLELSQDEGEPKVGQAQKRPPRRARHGHPCPHSQPQTHHRRQHHAQPRRSERAERAPLCRGEKGYAGAPLGDSESSMSEVYSPASSSLSSDSDESGGLVWPQQLPPRLAPSSSSASPPQASDSTSSQTKAFVKIKASHALKKKILRFRSGSLKVMTTV